MAKKKRPRARGLVIGHLERISSSVFDRYRKVITDLVGGKHGIYALYRNKRLYYVGLATDLKKRLNRHLKDRHTGKWNVFSLYLVRSEPHLRDLESLAIRISEPKGNKMRGKFGGAPDLRKLLKRKVQAVFVAEMDSLLGTPAKVVKVPGKRTKHSKKRGSRKSAGKIALRGLLASKRLRGTYKGKVHKAWVYKSGRIKLKETGKLFNTPSAAAYALLKFNVNGWSFWRYKNAKGEWVRLREVRKGAAV